VDPRCSPSTPSRHVRECARRRHGDRTTPEGREIKGSSHTRADAGRTALRVPRRRATTAKSRHRSQRGEPKYRIAIEGTKSAVPAHAVDWAHAVLLPAAITSCTRSIARTALIAPPQSRNQAAKETRMRRRWRSAPRGSRSSPRKTSYCSDADGQIKQQPIIRHRKAPWPVAGALPHQFHTQPVCYGAAARRMVTPFAKQLTHVHRQMRTITGQIAAEPIPQGGQQLQG